MGADVVLGEAQFLGVVERVDEESVRVRAQGGDQGEVPYEIFVDLHHALPFSLLAPHERGDGQAEAKLGEDAQLNEHARVGQDEDGVVEVLVRFAGLRDVDR